MKKSHAVVLYGSSAAVGIIAGILLLMKTGEPKSPPKIPDPGKGPGQFDLVGEAMEGKTNRNDFQYVWKFVLDERHDALVRGDGGRFVLIDDDRHK